MRRSTVGFWLFVSSGNEAGLLKSMKGLMPVVPYASSLNVSLNFWTCKTSWTRIHPATVSIFITLFRTSGSVTSVYGAGSLLAPDLHLLSVYLCKWYEYVPEHINEAPTDAWERCEYVSGGRTWLMLCTWNSGSAMLQEIRDFCHGNIPGSLSEVLVL